MFTLSRRISPANLGKSLALLLVVAAVVWSRQPSKETWLLTSFANPRLHQSSVFLSPDGRYLGGATVAAKTQERSSSVQCYRGSEQVMGLCYFKDNWYAVFEKWIPHYSVTFAKSVLRKSSSPLTLSSGEPVSVVSGAPYMLTSIRDKLLIGRLASRDGKIKSLLSVSDDGTNFDNAPIIYNGRAVVLAIAEYDGMIYVSFSASEESPCQVRRANSLESLAKGEVVYSGAAPVLSMLGTDEGLLVSFAGPEPGSTNSIRMSIGEKPLERSAVIYEGPLTVCGLLTYRNDYLAVLREVKGEITQFQIRRSSNLASLVDGEIVYAGGSPVTGLAIGYEGPLLKSPAEPRVMHASLFGGLSSDCKSSLGAAGVSLAASVTACQRAPTTVIGAVPCAASVGSFVSNAYAAYKNCVPPANPNPFPSPGPTPTPPGSAGPKKCPDLIANESEPHCSDLVANEANSRCRDLIAHEASPHDGGRGLGGGAERSAPEHECARDIAREGSRGL